MKKLSIIVKDQTQLEQIEQLRGERSAEEFVRMLIDAGLKFGMQQKKSIRFAATKPEFKSLDIAAITAALKEKDPKNPVHLEVGRLVKDYTTQLSNHAKKNGNKLPASLRINAQAAIERVAFQITAESIKSFVQGSKRAV